MSLALRRPELRKPLESRSRSLFDRWSLLALIVASIVGMPALVVAMSVLVPNVDVWHHLATTVLSDYISNTFVLIFGVGIGVTVIGVSTAWLVAICRFPGRGIAEWALLLPFAVPTYIMGYTYTDFFQFAGPFQTTLRDLMGWTRDDYWFPQIRSLEGAIFVMTMVLFPYVYLLTRTAFLSQSRCLLDVTRTLGRTPWRHFLEVALPMARPAIAGGVALALMETVADFGTVQYFGISTFTTGIYRTWFAMGEPIAAAQLSAMLMIFVLVILWLERHNRGQARYDHTTAMRPLKCYELTGMKRYLATAICWLPIILGFILPVTVLVSMAIEQGDEMFLGKFWTLARNSFSLAATAAFLIVGVAILLAYAVRLRDNALVKGAVRIASLGYAIPGTVIAVGILIPFARADNAINSWAQTYLGFSTGLLLSGTILILLFAYLVRFLALAMHSVESGLTKINRNLDDAARSLGHGSTSTLFKVHMPLLRGALLAGFVLVFVDVLKELPATLILRPFNFETLAARVYHLASDERLAEASTAALAIVLVGLLPIIFLVRAISGARPSET